MLVSIALTIAALFPPELANIDWAVTGVDVFVVAGVVVEVFAVGVDPGNVAMPLVAGLAKLAIYWLTTAGFALVALVAAATAAGSFTSMLFWAM